MSSSTALDAGTYALEDRYTLEQGQVFMTGLQALARLPLEQLRADRAAGLRTAAFWSGYPGSPLGGLDAAVRAAVAQAPDLPIVHHAAVNEEQAATAVMGSQLAAARPDPTYDGVLGIWYGKAPGVDRASDAIRHGVFAGADPNGGAVVIAGDDPAAKSSTIPSSSAGALADLCVPVLYPASPSEVLDLGRHAVALSRATGLWTALKIVADVADAAASVTLSPDAVRPVIPTLDGVPYAHSPDGYLLTPRTVEVEAEIQNVRRPLAIEYAALNKLNHITVDPPDAWLGIIASGITYRELREALGRLGLRTDAEIAAVGVRLICMHMPMPASEARARLFARGLGQMLVVEEKQPNIESQLKDALYPLADRPVIVGKCDEQGERLFAAHGSLTADDLMAPLRARLSQRADVAAQLVPERPERRKIDVPLMVSLDVSLDVSPGADVATGDASPDAPATKRTPYFCSGCPHNRSVRVPDGAVVGAGIGCHTMALLLRPDQVGDIAGLTCMGQEGAQWIGMEPFVGTEHIFQNLGDGTYFHSGRLAVAGAVASGVNITYKLLWNQAVAMTGGQDPAGGTAVADVCRALLATGVARVLITTEDTGRYRGVALPAGVDVWGRERLIEAQEQLAAVAGTTVLIHDQQCAAEARRGRKRGTVATPPQRVVINERICEGCGDCGQISNCLSVQPTSTPFGRKTRIDQTTCNLDFSCLEGDCPSFMTVRERGPLRRAVRSVLAAANPANWGGSRRAAGRRRSGDTIADAAVVPEPPVELPEPVQLFDPADGVAVRMCGIGGTGVVTVTQLLGIAAMFDGLEVRSLDQIGLSQKAGPVVGDLRIAQAGNSPTARVGVAQADLLLAFDQLVAASPTGLDTARAGHTVIVGSSTPTPTGAMISEPSIEMPSAEELGAKLAAVARPGGCHFADVRAVTETLLGSSVTANVFTLGMATQAGGLPISSHSIEEAIELNGVAVEANLKAFRWGRAFVARPADVAVAVAAVAPRTAQSGGTADDQRDNQREVSPRVAELAADDFELRDHLALLHSELVAYGSRTLAERWLNVVSEVAAADRAASYPSAAGATGAAATSGRESLVGLAAAGLFKLMAYKDEYEVARLLCDREATRQADEMAAESGGYVAYMLHPPLLRALGMKRKLALGPAWRPAFRLLARMKGLRGTWLDPFGHTKVRRTERALITEFTTALSTAAHHLADAASLSASSQPAASDPAVNDTTNSTPNEAAISSAAHRLAEIARAPELIRGYEEIKLRGVPTFRAVLAETD